MINWLLWKYRFDLTYSPCHKAFCEFCRCWKQLCRMRLLLSRWPFFPCRLTLEKSLHLQGSMSLSLEHIGAHVVWSMPFSHRLYNVPCCQALLNVPKCPLPRGALRPESWSLIQPMMQDPLFTLKTNVHQQKFALTCSQQSGKISLWSTCWWNNCATAIRQRAIIFTQLRQCLFLRWTQDSSPGPDDLFYSQNTLSFRQLLRSCPITICL